MTIGEAKELVSTLLSPDFISSSVTGYYYATRKSNYAGIEQRWLVVESTERKKSDLRQLERGYPTQKLVHYPSSKNCY